MRTRGVRCGRGQRIFRRPKGGAGGDAGQVIPLVILVVILAAVMAVGAGRLATQAVLVAQAQTAADAAALAGAAAGRPAATAAAKANDARILRFEASGSEVEVVIERRGAQAVARARRERIAGSAWDHPG
ncbi:MAG: hypothetical protein ACR2H3_14240 [Acidimicrobiales bacterium]